MRLQQLLSTNDALGNHSSASQHIHTIYSNVAAALVVADNAVSFCYCYTSCICCLVVSCLLLLNACYCVNRLTVTRYPLSLSIQPKSYFSNCQYMLYGKNQNFLFLFTAINLLRSSLFISSSQSFNIAWYIVLLLVIINPQHNPDANSIFTCGENKIT